MSLSLGAVGVLQLSPFLSPPGILGTLIILALVLLVGRFLLSLAWRLVLIAIAVVIGLWLLGALGSGLGIL